MEVEGVVKEERKDGLDGCENEGTNQQPELSLHALTRAMGQQTMQVVGMLGRRPIQVLIDSGSTHNFLLVGLAHKLGLLVEDMSIVSVRVTNGEQLPCSKVIRNFTLKMQGCVFGTDVFLIPLERYDFVTPRPSIPLQTSIYGDIRNKYNPAFSFNNSYISGSIQIWIIKHKSSARSPYYVQVQSNKLSFYIRKYKNITGYEPFITIQYIIKITTLR
ncbi:RVP_2 domain-containing protein [Cephalotus follicularis]|uniref:RVP_2 domain-containing protein n=1 Tax=Cephalotus follicularis TaxID=3775 RepID=A0A1Q3BA80_CEPFO|nr:RVP_2 domain-containing protein [Cephalotus follicularis]